MSTDKPAILGGTAIFSSPVTLLMPNLGIRSELIQDLGTVISGGLISNAGQVKKFEAAAAEYMNAEYCVAVNSGTSALILALRALGVHGEVILPSFTFFATAHAAIWNNLNPVFVDCEADTFNISPSEVERAITERTAAIIGVHVNGNPASIEDLQRIASKYGVPLIFDSAHAFGSHYHGQPIGRFGAAECFSLSPTKTVTACEGGLVATNDADLAKLLRAARNYGDSGNYDPELIGLSTRMSELHATVGLHSLKQVEYEVRRRNEIARIYKKYLSEIDALSFQKVLTGNRSAYGNFAVVVDSEFGLERDAICRALEKENITTRKYFHPPVHRQKQYRAYSKSPASPLEITQRLSDSVVCLPIYSGLSDGDISGICSAIDRIHRYRAEIHESWQ